MRISALMIMRGPLLLRELVLHTGCKGALHRGRFWALQLIRTKQSHLRRWVHCREERVVSFGREKSHRCKRKKPPGAQPCVKLPTSDALPLRQSCEHH